MRMEYCLYYLADNLWLLPLLLMGAYCTAACCHEAGHLLAGLCCGGKLLLIRVGGLLFIKGSRGGQIVCRRGLSPGQCLMLLPKRFACLAALGGPIGNLLLAWGLCRHQVLLPTADVFCGYELLFWLMLRSIQLNSALMAAFSLLPLKKEVSDGTLFYRLLCRKRYQRLFFMEQQKGFVLIEAGLYEELLG